MNCKAKIRCCEEQYLQESSKDPCKQHDKKQAVSELRPCLKIYSPISTVLYQLCVDCPLSKLQKYYSRIKVCHSANDSNARVPFSMVKNEGNGSFATIPKWPMNVVGGTFSYVRHDDRDPR